MSFPAIFDHLFARLTERLPSLLSVLAIIFLGWILSYIVSKVTSRLLKRFGLNQALHDSELAQNLEKVQPGRTLVDFVASVTFWLLWTYIILAAVNTYNVEASSVPIAMAMAFLPRLFASFIILIGGVLLAQFVGRWAELGVAALGAEFHEALGKAVRLVLVVIVAITAIETLGVDSNIANHYLW